MLFCFSYLGEPWFNDPEWEIWEGDCLVNCNFLRMGFSSSHVWMWELDYKERRQCQRIDAFELWYWRRLLRVPWTARRSNQSILKEFSPEYSLEGLRLKLKLQYFGHLMRTDSLEKTLMLGKIEGTRRGQQRMRCVASLTRWTWVWAAFRSWWRTEKPGMLQPVGSQRIGHDWVTELNWRVGASEWRAFGHHT